MRRASLLTLVTCVALAFAAGPAFAGVTIFLSEDTTAGSLVVEVPEIDTTAAIAGGSLGIWVIPGAGDEAVLNGISLDLGSDAIEFDFLGTSAVGNPTVGGGSDIRWFSETVPGHHIETVTDQALTNIIGVAVDAGQGTGQEGEGLGTGGGTTVFDAGTGAYLFATIDYNAEMDATGALTLSENLNGIIDSLDALVTGNTLTGATFAPDPGFVLLLGDANRNGIVDGSDYASVTSNFGGVYAPNDPLGLGDANGNGIVDGSDYASVTSNFGMVAPGAASATASAVPEPSTLLVLMLAGVAGLALRVRPRS